MLNKSVLNSDGKVMKDAGSVVSLLNDYKTNTEELNDDIFIHIPQVLPKSSEVKPIKGIKKFKHLQDFKMYYFFIGLFPRSNMGKIMPKLIKYYFYYLLKILILEDQ
jgi:hypothetical protein